MDEKKLMERLRQGSRSALEQAVARYTPYVSVTAWRAMGPAATREDLEEVVSDVFFALWEHAGELDPARGLLPWLGTVARNRAVDRLRAHRTWAEPEGEASSPGPEEALEQRERTEALWRAVEALGEPDSTLFLRYYYCGDKLHQAANALGMNLSTAKTRLRRGRQKLKELLNEGGEAD